MDKQSGGWGGSPTTARLHLWAMIHLSLIRVPGFLLVQPIGRPAEPFSAQSPPAVKTRKSTRWTRVLTTKRGILSCRGSLVKEEARKRIININTGRSEYRMDLQSLPVLIWNKICRRYEIRKVYHTKVLSGTKKERNQWVCFVVKGILGQRYYESDNLTGRQQELVRSFGFFSPSRNGAALQRPRNACSC